MATIEKTHGEIQVGDIIFNQGYEFRVVAVRKNPDAEGTLIVRYDAEATASPRNDGIRRTRYAKATYGAAGWVPCTVVAP